MSNPIRPLVILGLDPGLLRTGWGVVRAEGSRLSYVAHGVIRPNDKAAFPNRLAELFAAIEDVLAAQRPDLAARLVADPNPAPRLANPWRVGLGLIDLLLSRRVAGWAQDSARGLAGLRRLAALRH